MHEFNAITSMMSVIKGVGRMMFMREQQLALEINNVASGKDYFISFRFKLLSSVYS